MLKWIGLFGSCAALASGMPLAAQEQIAVEEGVVWTQQFSGFPFPPAIAGFTRTEVVQYDKEGFNISATMQDSATGTTATLYVYRAGVPDLPIWADRAATSMLSSKAYGSFNFDQAMAGSFALPGMESATGYRIAAPVSGSESTSTGVTIHITNGWLVKLRMTSRSLDVSALDRRMMDVLAGLQGPPATEPAVPFRPIDDCSEKLEIKRDAKLVRLDMMGVILLGAAISAGREEQQEKKADPSGPTVWCRDEVGDGFAVYRADQSDEGYLVALGDSGITASVGRYSTPGLMNPSRGYLITVSDGVTEEILPPLTRMPKVEQVLSFAGRIGPVTTIDVRPGGSGGQTIHVTTD